MLGTCRERLEGGKMMRMGMRRDDSRGMNEILDNTLGLDCIERNKERIMGNKS